MIDSLKHMPREEVAAAAKTLGYAGRRPSELSTDEWAALYAVVYPPAHRDPDPEPPPPEQATLPLTKPLPAREPGDDEIPAGVIDTTPPEWTPEQIAEFDAGIPF